MSPFLSSFPLPGHSGTCDDHNNSQELYFLTAPGGPGNSSSISLLPTSHLCRAEDNTLHSMWRGTGEKGWLELDLLLLQRYALSLSLLTILTVLLHFWMADGCIICKPPSPHTHGICLACPARWLGFGSTRCSCWDCWLEKHLPPEPVN